MAHLIAKSVGGAVVIALVAGVVYEQLGERSDRERLPRIGRAVDIGGRSLNLFCSGKGTPAVIFDSGNGQPGYAWSSIQSEIAKDTQACWFDRAGLGWSDPGPFPRTSGATSRDLHVLLHRAGIPAPYILVGHSLGGLDARVYNGMYPTELSGMVLVDAAHEDEARRAPASMLGRTAPRIFWHPIWIAAQFARLAGIIRLTTPRPTVAESGSGLTRQQIVDALRRQPKSIATLADATEPESYREAESAGGFGDRPLIVLTRGKMPDLSNPSEFDREYAAYQEVWMHEIQPKLARLSTRGRQIIVENSGHDIPDEAPEAIIAAVRDVLAEARSRS